MSFWALLAWMLLSAPSLAHACSVCSGGDNDNKNEFIATTALMTFLPLLLIGGVIYGLWRRAQRLEREGAAVVAADPS